MTGKMLGEKLLFKITWTQIIQIKVNIFMYIQKKSVKPRRNLNCARIGCYQLRDTREQLQITLMKAGKRHSWLLLLPENS